MSIAAHTWKITFRLPTLGNVLETVYIDAPTAADALVMLDVLHPAAGAGEKLPRSRAGLIEWVSPSSAAFKMPRLR